MKRDLAEYVTPFIYSERIRVRRDIQEGVVKMLRRDVKHKKITEVTGVSPHHIIEIARLNGLSRRNKITFEDIADIRRMREEEKMPWTDIAKVYGVDHTTVLHHAKKYGIGKGIVAKRKQLVLRPGQRHPKYRNIRLHKTRRGFRRCSFLTKHVGKYDHLFNEPVNPGRSYQSFIEDGTVRLVPGVHIIGEENRELSSN